MKIGMAYVVVGLLVYQIMKWFGKLALCNATPLILNTPDPILNKCLILRGGDWLTFTVLTNKICTTTLLFTVSSITHHVIITNPNHFGHIQPPWVGTPWFTCDLRPAGGELWEERQRPADAGWKAESEIYWPWTNSWKVQVPSRNDCYIAIENDHWNSEFSH